MELGAFPCLSWSKSDSSPSQILKEFLETRPSDRWLMMGSHAAHSDVQLWTAWHCCERRFFRKTSLARTIDAEFLRFIAGTHHISEAFQRAGVSEEGSDGWIIYRPERDENESLDEGISPSKEYLESFESTALEILESLNLTASNAPLELNLENAGKLGMDTNDLEMDNFEDALIGFILSSEFNT